MERGAIYIILVVETLCGGGNEKSLWTKQTSPSLFCGVKRENEYGAVSVLDKREACALSFLSSVRKSHVRPVELHLLHAGFMVSHFFRRILFKSM